MKLRYYADAPNYDDHERILDLLHTIYDRYGVAVEIERVNRRFGSLPPFPGELRDGTPEDVYDRDFHYNRTLGSNVGESPSKAFKSSGRHVDIDGYVGIVDDGLVWATTRRGDPIGGGRDHDDESTTIGFLDQVVKRGLDAIEEKYLSDDERERNVLDQFLAADVIDGTVHRDVTVGTALVPDHPGQGIRDSAAELVTRTAEAVIQTEDQDWILETGKIFDAPTIDAAIGNVLVRDRLYRLDENLGPDETNPTVVFGTEPWHLDVDGVPDALDRMASISESVDVRVFVRRAGSFRRLMNDRGMEEGKTHTRQP